MSGVLLRRGGVQKRRNGSVLFAWIVLNSGIGRGRAPVTLATAGRHRRAGRRAHVRPLHGVHFCGHACDRSNLAGPSALVVRCSSKGLVDHGDPLLPRTAQAHCHRRHRESVDISRVPWGAAARDRTGRIRSRHEPTVAGVGRGQDTSAKRWGLAPDQRHGKWRHARHLPAASRELGEPETRGLLFGDFVHAARRAKSRARDDQGGVRHQRLGRRAAGQLLGVQDHRVEFPHAAARPASNAPRGNYQLPFRSTSASSRSTVCWPMSTRARSSRRTSKA